MSDVRTPFSLWIVRLLFALSTTVAIPAALRGSTLLSGLRSVGAEVIGEKLLLCKADETIVPVDRELGKISKYKSVVLEDKAGDILHVVDLWGFDTLGFNFLKIKIDRRQSPLSARIEKIGSYFSLDFPALTCNHSNTAQQSC